MGQVKNVMLHRHSQEGATADATEYVVCVGVEMPVGMSVLRHAVSSILDLL